MPRKLRLPETPEDRQKRIMADRAKRAQARQTRPESLSPVTEGAGFWIEWDPPGLSAQAQKQRRLYWTGKLDKPWTFLKTDRELYNGPEETELGRAEAGRHLPAARELVGLPDDYEPPVSQAPEPAPEPDLSQTGLDAKLKRVREGLPAELAEEPDDL